jgi:hypothetical protein
MNREVHVRFWESPEVKVLRATRQSRRFLARRRHVRVAFNLGSAECPALPVEAIGLDMIQAPKPEPRTVRYSCALMSPRPSTTLADFGD